MRNLILCGFLITTLFIDIQVFGQDVKSAKSDPNIPIFEIKNDLGQTVFAVYPGGVHIFVDDTQLKATGGGFKVGRIGTEKATLGDIFTIAPGEVNVYLDNPVKATGGGFKVGRIGTEKAGGEPDNYLTVTPDSTRVNVAEASKSGFAVGKIGATDNIDFLNLTPNNYFIGHRAGESITTGLYNTFIGYETGINTTSPDGNIFIGFNTGRENTVGALNVFIGNGVGYNFIGDNDGEENIFIGNNAGYNCSTTANSIFIGTRSGYNAGLAYGNTFVGDRTASMGTAGDNNTIIGSAAGFRTNGAENVFIGSYAGNGNTSGTNNTFIGYNAGAGNATGKNNIFIGNSAGADELGSEKLYIANTNTATPLIYGEFDTKNVTVTGNLYATGELASTSDIRLKTNVIKLNSGLEAILLLNGYTFNWNNVAKDKLGYPEKKQLGLVAQEVEKILPELVSTSPNGYKAIDYSKLTPVLVEAIKEQNVTILDLEDRIKELEKSNAKLSIEVEELQQLKTDILELKKLIKDKNE